MESIYQIVVPILTALLTGVIGPIILYYLSSDGEEEESSEIESENTGLSNKIEERSGEIDKKINDQLEEIRENLDADRSWIIEFHDEREAYEDLENLKKFSMVYESVSPGVSEEIDNFEDLLVSFFIEMVRDIVDQKELFYEDVSDIDNEDVRQIFNQKGNCSMYMFAMETIDDILIGILGVDYVREDKTLSKREKMYLRKQAYSLAGYLQNREIE